MLALNSVKSFKNENICKEMEFYNSGKNKVGCQYWVLFFFFFLF